MGYFIWAIFPGILSWVSLTGDFSHFPPCRLSRHSPLPSALPYLCSSTMCILYPIMYYITLHYIILHYIALHYYYITLHHTHYKRSMIQCNVIIILPSSTHTFRLLCPSTPPPFLSHPFPLHSSAIPILSIPFSILYPTLPPSLTPHSHPTLPLLCFSQLFPSNFQFYSISH